MKTKNGLAPFLPFAFFCLFVGVSFFVTPLLWAQNTGTSSKKAEKHYEEAMQSFKIRNFEKGIYELKKAVQNDPDYFDAHYELANNYKILNKTKEHLIHLRKAAQLNPQDSRFSDMYFQYGEVLLLQDGDYTEAEAQFSKYLTMKKEGRYSKMAVKHLATCKYALEGMKNPLKFEPKQMPDPLNQFPLQYFPVATADDEEMYFTARLSNQRKDYEDIYHTRKIDGVWQAPTLVEDLNTPFNEGTCSISADGKTMIFTVCEGVPERRVIGRCDLFISYKKGDKWTKPQNLGENVNSTAWDTQPSLSADGRTLYFISDRKTAQTIGGIDIWYSQLQADGEWSPAQNLGIPINTAGHEVGVFIHTNGRTLYFASDTHIGYGSYDLFKAEKLPDGTWEKPQNLGYPINTFSDQSGIFVSADGKKGYYSDLKMDDENMFYSYLFEFELPQEAQAKTQSRYVKGTIYDAQTKRPLGAKIELYNLETQKPESLLASDDKNGSYLFVMNEGGKYALNVNKESYLFESQSFDFSKEAQNLTIDFYLKKIEKGSKVVLSNIFFETAKWDLKSESITELDLVVKYLKENPSIKIEIAGHTDNVGSQASNQNLSEKRAQAVVEYLKDKGIAQERLIAKGYGQTQPAHPNDNDENRAKNRRIEFEIL
ncbi:OmpA family protein [Hugenholtzia roseola]|uniref:OmpA family protein n=1 Tax=Hugenholtzia roseola TaxID=1002 RepID=UPI0003FB67F1|nr:OmpA family protein [Hugenholtzia roseola]